MIISLGVTTVVELFAEPIGLSLGVAALLRLVALPPTPIATPGKVLNATARRTIGQDVVSHGLHMAGRLDALVGWHGHGHQCFSSVGWVISREVPVRPIH